MPELPEIETITKALQVIVGQKIIDIELLRTDIIKQRDYEPADVLGHLITGIARRGKYIIINTDNKRRIIIHLGMSGRFYMLDAGLEANEPHTHAIIYVSNNIRLIYQDTRRFGGVWFINNPESFFAKLGIEPLDDGFNAQYLQAIINNRRVPIKTLLLNQNVISGIGNIYADEALFAAGIRPNRPAGSLCNQEINNLCKAVKEVLINGINQRGTTFRDYRDGFNNSGGFQNYLQVYGKEKQACARCSHTITRDIIGGRSSHYCPHCQQ